MVDSEEVVGRRLERFAQYSGLATISVEWCALVLYYLKMPAFFGREYPISYFATFPQTRLVFSLCYTLAAVFFWIFAKHHLARYYRVPVKLFGISMLLFAGMAMVPYHPVDPLNEAIHTSLAVSSGLLFLLGMYLIARWSRDHRLFVISMAAIVANVSFSAGFFLTASTSPLKFSLEVASWLALQLWIIWISWYVHRQKERT